jgi:hypothetical protein
LRGSCERGAGIRACTVGTPADVYLKDVLSDRTKVELPSLDEGKPRLKMTAIPVLLLQIAAVE